jgi:hypothetical protein
MNMKKDILLTFFVCMLTMPAAAQDELNSRSMTVEGTYNPQVTEASKITPVPEKNSIRTNSGSVTYITEGKEYNRFSRKPMNTFSSADSASELRKYYGTVKLGYGLRNNIDGLVDFNWNPTEKDKLSINGSLYGWNTEMKNEWRSKLYSTYWKADYSHIFDNIILNVNGAFGREAFNYMPGYLMNPDSIIDLDMDITKGSLVTEIRSVKGDDLDFDMKIGWYGLKRGDININNTEKNKENILRIEGAASIPYSDGRLGVKYRQKSAFYNWNGLSEFKNFTTISLSPYWRWSDEEMEFNIGVNFDVRNRVGSRLMASPDLWFKYKPNTDVTLYGQLKGGIQDNEVRRLNALSPYWSENSQIRDGYTFADLSVGIKYVASASVQMYMGGGLKYSKDELFQVMSNDYVVTSRIFQDKASLLYLNMGSDMSFSGKYDLSLDILLADWNTKDLNTSLILKPWFDMNFNARANIYGPLDANLKYNVSIFEKRNGFRLPMVNNLSIGFDYDLKDNVSLFADFCNVLDQSYYYYAGYRALKFSFMLGASISF